MYLPDNPKILFICVTVNLQTKCNLTLESLIIQFLPVLIMPFSGNTKCWCRMTTRSTKLETGRPDDTINSQEFSILVCVTNWKQEAPMTQLIHRNLVF